MPSIINHKPNCAAAVYRLIGGPIWVASKHQPRTANGKRLIHSNNLPVRGLMALAGSRIA
jgi:fructose-1,6-bisphosphatase/inositol monophosphatase family enzyme